MRDTSGGRWSAARGGVMAKRKRPRDRILDVRVERGVLSISIGVETLAHAVHWNSDLEEYDEKRGVYVRPRVTNPDAFAREVVAALSEEAEDGTTAVHAMLDAACVKAIEDGAAVEPEDGGEVDSP